MEAINVLSVKTEMILWIKLFLMQNILFIMNTYLLVENCLKLVTLVKTFLCYSIHAVVYRSHGIIFITNMEIKFLFLFLSYTVFRDSKIYRCVFFCNLIMAFLIISGIGIYCFSGERGLTMIQRNWFSRKVYRTEAVKVIKTLSLFCSILICTACPKNIQSDLWGWSYCHKSVPVFCP